MIQMVYAANLLMHIAYAAPAWTRSCQQLFAGDKHA